jgi:hypothetical protein
VERGYEREGDKRDCVKEREKEGNKIERVRQRETGTSSEKEIVIRGREKKRENKREGKRMK